MQMMAAPGEMSFSRPTDDTLLVRLAGAWTIKEELPSVEEILKQADSGPPLQRIAFDTHDLGRWDSGLITFLLKVFDQCSQRQIDADQGQGCRMGCDGYWTWPPLCRRRKMLARWLWMNRSWSRLAEPVWTWLAR